MWANHFWYTKCNISLLSPYFLQFLLQMLAWITENRHEFLLNYAEIGNDISSAEELQDEHRNFESSCMVRYFIHNGHISGDKIYNHCSWNLSSECFYNHNCHFFLVISQLYVSVVSIYETFETYGSYNHFSYNAILVCHVLITLGLLKVLNPISPCIE